MRWDGKWAVKFSFLSHYFWPLSLITPQFCIYFSLSEQPHSRAECLPLPLNNHLLVTISAWPCLWALQALPVVTIHLTTLVSGPPPPIILLGNFSAKNILCGSFLTNERWRICPHISECVIQHASVFRVGSLICYAHSLLLSRPGGSPFNVPLFQIHIVLFTTQYVPTPLFLVQIKLATLMGLGGFLLDMTYRTANPLSSASRCSVSPVGYHGVLHIPHCIPVHCQNAVWALWLFIAHPTEENWFGCDP
jgi:hypothetical protein